ncbi:MAG: hypothetical protein ACREF4_10765 [Gammaproteobacteria bacterium]
MSNNLPTDRHCPPWCAEHHDVEDSVGPAVAHRAAELDPHVSVSRLVRGPDAVWTTIHLRPDLLNASQARAVAAALVTAADMLDGAVPVDVSTDHDWHAWQRALVRLGASGAIEMTGCAVIVEFDTDENATLRLHAPEGTGVERVREAVRAAAVALGVMR